MRNYLAKNIEDFIKHAPKESREKLKQLANIKKLPEIIEKLK